MQWMDRTTRPRPAALAPRPWLLCGLILAALPAAAQVLTIGKDGVPLRDGQSAPVDRRYAQVQPTAVPLPAAPLDPKARFELIRYLQADQGFAMRPIPRGHKGLTLAANGALSPAGEPYVAMITQQGTSAKPGERVAITDVQVERDKIVLLLNGGPDPKHRFLRHVQVGGMGGMPPVVQDNGEQAAGARLTLTFKDRVPEVTGKDVEALLAPLISFQVKTPIQAFTDTLPPALKSAILDHHVLVGMSTDMVLFALGKPERKVRESDGDMPFEEWIYGAPPAAVQFVRINGNRVIRVEVAAVGKAPVIFDKDEVSALMRTDGSPAVPERSARTVEMGDVVKDPDRQAPSAPPSLGAPSPGQTAPSPADQRVGTMKPVRFPQQAPDDHPVAHRNDPPKDDASGDPPANKEDPAKAPPAVVPAQPPAPSKPGPD